MKPTISDTYIQKGMRYPALNDLIAKAHNKYELVLATAKRAREIVDGSEPLVKITIDNPISIATAEISENLVELNNPAFDHGTVELSAPERVVFPDEIEEQETAEASADSIEDC